MIRFGSLLVRLIVTLCTVALAVFVGWQLWIYYMDAPWTRDGRVRADVVAVAPDVSGLKDGVGNVVRNPRFADPGVDDWHPLDPFARQFGRYAARP